MNDEPGAEDLVKALEPVTKLAHSPAAYGTNVIIGFSDVLDACKRGLGACLQSAHGNLFHIAACTGQFGVCSVMNLLHCSRDCIPPMISCTGSAMGDFGAVFGCVANFIACGIGGCLNNGGAGAEDLIKALEPVTKLAHSPAAYGTNVIIGFSDVLAACKTGLGACLNSAHGNIFHIAACTGQFGVCSAMNLLSCSKDCIPPMISCTTTSMGDFGAVFGCVAHFIACGIGGCINNGGGGGGDIGPMPPMPPMNDEPGADDLIKALE